MLLSTLRGGGQVQRRCLGFTPSTSTSGFLGMLEARAGHRGAGAVLLSQAISAGKLLLGKERSPAMPPAAPAAACPRCGAPFPSGSPSDQRCPGSLHLFPPPASP